MLRAGAPAGVVDPRPPNIDGFAGVDAAPPNSPPPVLPVFCACALPKSPPDAAGAEVAGAAVVLPKRPLEACGAPAGVVDDPNSPPPLGAAGLAAALPNRPPPDAGCCCCCCCPNGDAAGVAAAPVFAPGFPNRLLPVPDCAGADPLMAPELPKEKLGVLLLDAAPKRLPEAGAVEVVAC